MADKAHEETASSLSGDGDDDDDDDSASLNELDGANSADVECISLLKEIFPEESPQELQRIHRERISHRTTNNTLNNSSSKKLMRRTRRPSPVSIPYDFLRLPPEVAVRRYSDQDGRWHYQIVKDLEAFVVEQHRNYAAGTSIVSADDYDYFTRVIFRDDRVGLGMNLFEEGGIVRVHSLNDCDRHHLDLDSSPSFPGPKLSFAPGPASKAGIQPGDILVGMNGIAFCESLSPVEGILPHVVSSLRESPDPVVLHFLRLQLSVNDERMPASLPQIVTTQSLLDTSDFLEEAQSVELSFELDRTFHSTPILSMYTEDHNSVHPFARTLISRKLIREASAESTSQMLRQFTERARKWEATGSFTILSQKKAGESTFVPLMGVRKALCVRIVNTFLDADETAYTMWVCDVESGREWYAPVRYFRDFQDLRSATLSLHPSISQLAFPKGVLSIFGSPMRSETPSERETKCLQLESFVRSLNSIIYKEPLHPSMAEIAIHVQSFLGCDAVLGPSGLLGLATADNDIPSGSSRRKPSSQEEHVRIALKRSIQRYIYRLFLLDPLQKAVSTFISTLRSQGPRLRDIEQLQAEGQSALKNRAMQDLVRIQAFLDQLQEMILEGCMDDLHLIAEREDYEALHPKILVPFGSTARTTATGSDYWGRLVREAVREQIEIEVYVPLRGIVSRWLVNGWKHDDLEIHFKIRELRKRPGAFFRRLIVNYDQLDPVASILKQGVGQSTLPSVKLRAIVEAASEISRIFSKKQDNDGSGSQEEGTETYMGADKFLPIFIYCVVQAEMERPCALSILLRTLCDPINRLGETGYYLASFEAAVTHLHELDLTEERDDAQSSFVSVPL